MNNASIQTMVGAGGVFELVCGAQVVVSLFTRSEAFRLWGMTAMAYFYAHASKGILAAVAGGGPLAIDVLWGKKD